MAAIGGDYPSPVMVNGYSCRNCSDVAKAEHGVDPADPQGSRKAAREDREHDRSTPAPHFAAEARDRDRLEALHIAQTDRVNATAASAAIAAYGSPPPAPGDFVRLTG